MAQQQLSGKEQTLFRTLVKFYEAKQYKKAVKTAEQILKKTPDHADTIAMKALTLSAQGQTDEAFVLAKAALQKNMKSPICWHVYGLLYRSVKNLEEATKAYKFALRLDPESQQIQRDLAFLQVQSRDYQGYIQTRNDILQARPAIRANWNALAVAYHLSGDPEEAERRLKTYEETLKRPPMRMDHEHSEAQLYRNDLIAEQGDTERALEHLETIYKTNLDRTAVMEKKAKYLLQLGRKEEAEKAYRALLARNSEYRPYYEGLEKCLSLDRTSSEDTAKLAELYASFAEKNDRLDAPHRIPLDFLQGEEFKVAAQKYLQRMLSRGVPSTFNNVKSLYQVIAKRDIIQAIAEDISSESSETKVTNGDGPDKFQLAKLYFLAQHYNYHRCQDLSKAMEYIDQAIELNPKMVDLLMTKARIYKHMGDSQLAAKTMNEARELDLKDRYINTKCAKYHLRNNDNEKALDTMSKFTRNETVGGPLGDLHDMQCVWFITEDGEANLRQGKYGLALKRFKAIYDIFDTWQEDQFDFHHFSFRKGQIRAYVEMMKWEDHLREHPFYTRAALSAIKTYILLHDKPDIATSNGMPDFEGLSAEDKKKAIKKAKKEQERLEKAEMERREAEKKAQKAKANAEGEVKKEDPDPLGNRLLETKSPLDEAAKYLAPILEFSPKNIDGQKIGFELFIRRKKYLLALKCLRAIQSVDAENPALHEDLVRLRLALDSESDSPDPKTAEVLKACADIVPAKKDLTSFNDSFLNKHKESAQHVQHALQTRSVLDAASKSQNEKDLLATLDLPSTTMESTAAGLEILSGWKSDKAVKDQYLQAARKRYPDATVFKETS